MDPLASEEGLKLVEKGWGAADLPGRDAALQAERHDRPGGFADAPFDGMEAEGAVGDVRHAEVLAGGEQVLDPDRHERAERDLERPAAEVEVSGAACPGM